MIDLTPQEEQAMIERAKSGDPEANYKMSLWALEQAALEPTEERWNRLAAKCLVRAAEAGYPPAKKRTQELLQESKEAASPQKAPARKPASRPEVRREPQSFDPRDFPELTPEEEKFTFLDAFVGIPAFFKSLFTKAKSAAKPAPKAHENTAPSGGSRLKSAFDFSQWDDTKWKRMQVVCIVVCVILAIVITVMLLTAKHDSKKSDFSPLPTPPTVAVVVTPTPTPIYPDDDVRDEIASSNLEIFPTNGDYVTVETNAVVNTSGSVLRLRRGPGANYGEITAMDNDTPVEVFAYKNNWSLVRYDGRIWGWCSSDFLNFAPVTSSPTPTAVATDTPAPTETPADTTPEA